MSKLVVSGSLNRKYPKKYLILVPTPRNGFSQLKFCSPTLKQYLSDRTMSNTLELKD